MTDRELLELAAKAAGYQPDGSFGRGLTVVLDAGTEDQHSFAFDPLNDDGDALRLAVKLRISLVHEQEYMGGPVMETLEAITQPKSGDGFRTCMTECLNDQGADEMAAARRAITRAAAEIINAARSIFDVEAAQPAQPEGAGGSGGEGV